jgi:hypothetical protein
VANQRRGKAEMDANGPCVEPSKIEGSRRVDSNRLASYHRHCVSLDCGSICLPLKKKADCVFACRKRAKAKKLNSLFAVLKTVACFFDPTPKEL